MLCEEDGKMFFLFFEAWSLGDTSKLEDSSPIRALGWWLVLQFRAISTLPLSGREKRYLLSKLQRVWGIKLNSTDKGSKVEQNSKNQNETVSDQVNIFFLIWARSHINTTMGWIWGAFYKMWAMGVPLAADRLSEEESQISWKREIISFKSFGTNTVFPCAHYSELVNTQGIQSKTSKISELKKIVSIF